MTKVLNSALDFQKYDIISNANTGRTQDQNYEGQAMVVETLYYGKRVNETKIVRKLYIIIAMLYQLSYYKYLKEF